MNTLSFLHMIALQEKNEYLKELLKLIYKYLEKHTATNIKILLHDKYLSIYDDKVLLLKISAEVFLCSNPKQAI